MQELLIKFLLNPVAKITEKIPQAIRLWIISISVMGMILLQFAYTSGVFSRYLYAFALFCVFLGLIMLSGLTTKMKAIACSPLLWGCWIAVAVIIFASGIVLNEDHLANGLMWLVAFPVLFIIWENQPFDKLVEAIINGVYIAFAVFLLVSILKYPILNIKYTSFYHNPNSLSLYMTATFAAALTDLLEQKKFSARMLIIALVVGMTVAIAVYTSSRAGQYIMIFCAACALVIYFFIKNGSFVKKLLHVVLPTVLMTAILIPNGVHVVNVGQQIHAYMAQTKQEQAVIVETEIVETEIAETEIAETEIAETEIVETEIVETEVTEAQATEPQSVETLPVETVPDNQDILNSITAYNEVRHNQGTGEENTLDYYTSGRVELWKTYLKEVKLFGNPTEQVLFYEDGREIKDSAHCTLIQLAYEYGIIVAALFLLFNLAAGVKAVSFMYKNRAEDYSAFPVIIAVVYGMYYLLETIILPSVYLLTLLYFISQVPLMKKEENNRSGMDLEV